MLYEKLTRVNKYSEKIKELSILKRIAVDYPLLCRESVAKKLSQVADNLPSEYYLQVDSAYRTKKTENILFENRKNIIPGLVNDPQTGRSSHNSGGAVDVSLVDPDGREVNLSEPFTKYYQEPQLISNKVTLKAQNLRNTLNKVMVEAGFVAHPKEYWHFSYGDESWAKHTNEEVLYDEINLDSNLYYPFIKRILYKILRRLWKLTNKIFKIQTNY